MSVFRRLALSAIVSAAVGVPVVSQAQSCPTPPGKDVLLFVDNSSSITNAEFDEAQQAIAGIAASVLSRPGYRLAVVNWGCEGGRRTTRDGCRVDLATGTAIPGGWSSNPADFAYAGNNSAANRVCRSFGTNFAGSINRNNCGGANFSVNINDDYAQHGLKILEGVLYSGGTTGGNDSYNQPTLGPSAPTQQLMLIHMTDADPNFGRFDGTSIREMPSTETALGFYHYSNRFKNVRNAVIVGVGIDAAAANAVNRGEVGAFASRGGTGTDYDAAHPTAISTQAFDTGAPRIASYSAAYNDATILSAANTAFNATVPACVILRKQSVNGTGSFSFTGGTNGLPSALTLSTATTNPQAATGVFLSQFNTPTSITETIPSNWSLSSVGCVNASNSSVPVTSDLATGQLTIPANQVVAGAQLTCTFTNTYVPPSFGTCPADAYITRGATSTTVRLYTLGLADGTMTDQGTSPALADQVNAIGFRQQDGYIWGWGTGAATRRLVRIGAGGQADLPYATAPAGLPASANFYAADVSPAGIYTAVDDNGGRLWFIDVTTNAVVGASVPVSMSMIGTDIAYHPTDGNLYTVASGAVMRINPATGAATAVGISLPNDAPGGFGGVFFDNQGTLYAYKSNSPGGTGLVYRVFNVDGSGTLAYDLLSTSLTATSLDGARCPVAPPQGAPAVILRKTTMDGFSGPFAFAINNTVDTSGTVTTTAAGTPVQVDGDDSTPGVQPFTVETAALGQSLAINEADLPTGWGLTSASCSVDGNAVGSLTDTTYTIPGTSVVTGALFECDFTNTLRQTDIQVVKTASPNPVVSGDVVSYQIVVTNNGPLAADGAVLTDVAGAGQDCTAPGTTAICTATGGASCPSPTVPVSSLLGGGVTIPTLPMGGQVTFGLQCAVTASGF